MNRASRTMIELGAALAPGGEQERRESVNLAQATLRIALS
jgi:hypothetical protein